MAPTEKNEDRAGPGVTVWDQWQPACDACGRLESSLKKRQLLSCSGCLLAKYCSKECQKQDWSGSDGHKNRCHLFEADRKLSTVFAKSLGPGTINDPTLSLADKVIQWVVDERVRSGSKYDNRTFVIDRVDLLNRESSDELAARINWTKGNTDVHHTDRAKESHCKLLVGFCQLPNGKLADTQMWCIPTDYHLANTVLPPNFDLHRYITHVNRGVTHFHASFWPLPRDISDSALEASEAPDAYCTYFWDNFQLLSGLKGQGVTGIVNKDGTRTPLIKRSQSGHIRLCASGETDSDGPPEYKKQLENPSRMVAKIAGELDYFYLLQDKALSMTETKSPISAKTDAWLRSMGI
ncbi:hypothetical protein DFH09DRAFT_1069019 [Mycena vulgaris]|nr:hypothetical protein DFH09DRAFT_1069019 [Mycena vulgaris]